MSLPLYLIAPPGPRRDQHVGRLGARPTLVDGPDAFRDLAGREAGIVLVDRAAVSAEDVLGLAALMASAGPPWMLAEWVDEGTGFARSVSLGLPATLEQVGARSRGEDGTRAVLLELRSVLAEVAKARHDVNNPLTSALAEVQILLMDAEEAELREALEITQTQLRRMRDLIAATSHIRLPSH